MAFIRRFDNFPSIEQATAIEGVIIVDNAPPSTVGGVGSGAACMVGEFADCTYACAVSAAGLVTTNPRPIEVFSGQDLTDKAGGFDETLGVFGAECGSGFCALRNKQYSRLMIAPVDIVTPVSGAQGGVRLWRDLPTNNSATNPTPIVPVQAATVAAGRAFTNFLGRARLCQSVPFGDNIAFIAATDGSIIAVGLPQATQIFTSATATFLTSGVSVGDIFVIGVLGAAGAQGTNAGTYRVFGITNENTVVLERMNGQDFTVATWVTGVAMAYRVHIAKTADSAGSVAGVHVGLASSSGYRVLARPLDASITNGQVLTPVVIPSAGSATSWDTLSGLTAYTRPTAVSGGNSLIYDANVHAPNVANNTTMSTRYTNAIDALVDDDYPARDINLVVAARKSSTIASKLNSHCSTASAQGLSRTCVISPTLTTFSLSTVLSSAYPGVGANRSERVFYAWPGSRMLVPEAIGFAITLADGTTTTDGVLDDPTDAWLMSAISSLQPEFDPAQEQEPIPTIFAPMLSAQTGAVDRQTLQEYITLRAYGVCGLKTDPSVGVIFQSGITTSLTGRKLITSRRMADYVQDSLAMKMKPFVKLPKTQARKDDCVSEANAFLANLLSAGNPQAQRISAYTLDGRSGNTQAMDAAGIYVIIVRVRLLGELLDIILNTTIGETVNVTEVPLST